MKTISKVLTVCSIAAVATAGCFSQRALLENSKQPAMANPKVSSFTPGALWADNNGVHIS